MHKKKTRKSEAICSFKQNIRKQNTKIRNKNKDYYEAVVILKSNTIFEILKTHKKSADGLKSFSLEFKYNARHKRQTN